MVKFSLELDFFKMSDFCKEIKTRTMAGFLVGIPPTMLFYNLGNDRRTVTQIECPATRKGENVKWLYSHNKAANSITKMGLWDQQKITKWDILWNILVLSMVLEYFCVMNGCQWAGMLQKTCDWYGNKKAIRSPIRL